MRLLAARVVWLTLPLTAGTAAARALDDWATAPRITGAVLLWSAWGVGVVALLAPRPVGLTAVRVVAPTFAVLAIAAAIGGDASAVAAAGAIAGTIAAAALVADPAFALAAANEIAYGNERRFPLRTPPALYLAPVPVARAVVAAGVSVGPLLLADGSYLVGTLALVVGLPLAVLACRSLHTLARRWLVVVPAGVAVVDNMTLADPVLVVRRHLRALRAIDGTASPRSGVTDLRLGATLGSVTLELDGEVDIVRVGRGRRPSETLEPDGVLLAVCARDELLRSI